MAKPKYTKKELRTLVKGYFEICDKTNKAPTKGGLALYLDVTREYFSWHIKHKTNLSDTIKKAYMLIEEEWIQMLSSKNYSPAGVIFYLKNAYRWRDRVEADVTSGGERIGTIESSKIAQEIHALIYASKKDTESDPKPEGEKGTGK